MKKDYLLRKLLAGTSSLVMTLGSLTSLAVDSISQNNPSLLSQNADWDTPVINNNNIIIGGAHQVIFDRDVIIRDIDTQGNLGSINIENRNIPQNEAQLLITISNVIDSTNSTRISINLPRRNLFFNTLNKQSAILSIVGNDLAALSKIDLGGNRENTIRFNSNVIFAGKITAPANTNNGIIEINANVTFRGNVGDANSGSEKIIINAGHSLSLKGKIYNTKEYILQDASVLTVDTANISVVRSSINNAGTITLKGIGSYVQLGEVDKRLKEVNIHNKTNINRPVYTQKLVIKDNIIEINDILKTDTIHFENNLAGVDIKKGFVDPVVITTNDLGKVIYRDNGSIGMIGSAHHKLEEVRFENHNISLNSDIYSNKTHFYQGKYDLSNNVSIYGSALIEDATFNLQNKKIAFYGDVGMKGNITINMDYNALNNEIMIFNNGKLDIEPLTRINLKMAGTTTNGTVISVVKFNNYLDRQKWDTAQVRLYNSPNWSLRNNNTLLFDNGIRPVDSTQYHRPDEVQAADKYVPSSLRDLSYTEQHEEYSKEIMKIISDCVETKRDAAEVYTQVQQIVNRSENEDTKDKREFLYKAFNEIESNGEKGVKTASVAQLENRVDNTHTAAQYATRNAQESVISHIANTIIPNFLNNPVEGTQLGVSSGDDYKKKLAAWSNGFLSVTRHNDFNAKTKGVGFGFDYDPSTGMVTGVGLSFARSNIRDKDITQGKIKTKTSVVSLYTVQDFKRILFQGSVYVGRSNAKTRFNQKAGNNIEIVHSELKNHAIGVNSSIAYKIPIGAAMLIPDVGVGYHFIRDHAYKEKGTFLHNLTVPSKNTNRVHGNLGIKLLKNYVINSAVWTPEMHGNVLMNLKRKATKISSELAWGDIISKEGRKPEVFVYNIGAGLTSRTQNMEFAVNYGVYLSAKKYRKYQGSIKLKVML